MSWFSASGRRAWQSFLDRLFPRRRRLCQKPRQQPFFRAHVEALEDRLTPATFNVPAQMTLSAAIAAAAGNADSSSTILVATGNYTVANQVIDAPGKSLQIVGSGPGVIISGGEQNRVFTIESNVLLKDLVVTGGNVKGVPGQPSAQGGGILIKTGNVTLSNVAVRSNMVQGASGSGGATIHASTPANAATSNGTAGQNANGGGIYLTAGSLMLVDCSLTANKAVGGAGGKGGSYHTQHATTFNSYHNTFVGNGGAGGAARGGGLYVESGTVIGEQCLFSSNAATGGAGGAVDPGLSGQQAAAANGGSGAGGGFYCADPNFTASPPELPTLTLFNATVADNVAIGGIGGGKAGGGGPAFGGGGRAGWNLNMVSCKFDSDRALGGQGGPAADGQSEGPNAAGGLAGGGALAVSGFANLYGCNVTACTARGGNGGGTAIPGGSGGGGGDAEGGGIYVPGGSLLLVQGTVGNNLAQGGNGANGVAARNNDDPSNYTFSIPRTNDDRGLATSPSNRPYSVPIHHSGGHGFMGGGGGDGGNGGNAMGGGCYVNTGTLTLARATVTNDRALGGIAGSGANGVDGSAGGVDSTGHGGHWENAGGAGGDGGKGGNGGNAYGGAVYLTSFLPAGYGSGSGLYAYHCSFNGKATGGPGGAGGNAGNGEDAGGGGNPYGICGGNGGYTFGSDGGNAEGGGLYLGAINDAVLDGNSTSGSVDAGPAGPAGAPGQGGSPPYYDPSQITNSGFAAGLPGAAIPGNPGTASGAGLQNDSSITPATSGPAATQLDFSPLPPQIGAACVFPCPVYVVAVNDSGDVAGDFAGSVSVSLPISDPTLNGHLTQSASAGVAVFSDLSITNSGPGDVLLANSPSLNQIGYFSDVFEVSGPITGFINLSSPAITYGTPTVTLTGSVVAVDGSGAPTGTVTVSLAGQTQTVNLQADDTFTASFNSSTLAVAGSPYAVGFSYSGDDNFDPAIGNSTLTVTKATPTLTLNAPASGYYTGSPFAANPTLSDAAGIVSGADANDIRIEYFDNADDDNALPGPPTAVGSYYVQASFSGSDNFNSLPGQVGQNFTITAPPPPIFVNVSNPTVTFGSATATITGQLSSNNGLSVIPAGEAITLAIPDAYDDTSAISATASLDSNDHFSANFPTSGLHGATDGSAYEIDLSYPGDGIFAAATGNCTLTVNKAVPTLHLEPPANGTFTGDPFEALASVSGVDGDDYDGGETLEGVPVALVYKDQDGNALPEAPTGPGTFTVQATFAGSEDYTDASTEPQTFTIAPATTPTFCNLSVPDITYGAGSLTVSGHINANQGSETVPESDPINVGLDDLEGITAELTVHPDSSDDFTGAFHFGADSLPAGAYNVTFSYGGNPALGLAATTRSTSFSVAKATTEINLAVRSGTFTGDPFLADATVGVVMDYDVDSQSFASLEGVPVKVQYFDDNDNALPGAPSAPGEYSATASFAGSPDYASASATADFTISPATGPVISDVSPTQITFGAATTTFSGHLNADNDTGNLIRPGAGEVVNVTLGDQTVAAPLDGEDNFEATFATASLAVAGSPYTVTFNYAGDGTWAAADRSAELTVAKATPTLTVTPPASGAYTGDPFSAQATIAGVDGAAGDTLEDQAITIQYEYADGEGATPFTVAPTGADNYVVQASFSGSADYTSASTDWEPFTISQVKPTITLTPPASGTYNGNPFEATATCTGLDGDDLSSGVVLAYLDSGGHPLPGPPTEGGTYSVTAIYPGDDDYAPESSPTEVFTIEPVDVMVTLTPPASGTYTGDPFEATATCTGADGADLVSGLSIDYTNSEGQMVTEPPTDAGTYSVQAYYQGDDDYYGGESETEQFTINPASVYLTLLQPASGTYTGDPFDATADCTDENGHDLSFDVSVYYRNSQGEMLPAPADAGAYTVEASYSPDDNHLPTPSVTESFTIRQATPIITLHAPASGNYTGAPFAATANLIDVNGATVSSLDFVDPSIVYTDASGGVLPGAPISPGSYFVQADFPGSTNYAPVQSLQQPFTISAVTPTIAVAAASGPYTGQPMPVTSAIAGNDGQAGPTLEGVGLTLSYYLSGVPLPGAPISAGDYTVVASFAGSPDYNAAASAPTPFTIAQIDPTIRINAPSGPYTGQPYVATATIAGVDGSPGASLEGVGLSLTYSSGGIVLAGPPTDGGIYTVTATFAGSTDYNSLVSDPTTFTISPAAPTVTVTPTGGIYNGDPFPATGSATGVNGESLGPVTLSYQAAAGNTLPGAPTDAGTYTVIASFAGNGNYSAADSGPATFTIQQAAPEVSAQAPGGTYNGSPHPATGKATGVGGDDLDPVILTYYANGQPLPGAPIAAGTYTVIPAFPGNRDYSPATGSAVGFTIAQAAPTVTVSERDGTYNGSPFVATGSATGVNSENLTPLTFQYQNAAGQTIAGAPTDAGTYSVIATFTGNANYGSGQSQPFDFTIARANLTISVTDAGGVYNGKAFPATGLATGVNGVSLGVVTLTYVNSSNQTLTAAPINPGKYSVTASFAGSSDYLPGSAQTSFTIENVVMTLTSSANPSLVNSAVTFTAKVSAVGTKTTPSGALTFLDGTTVLGTATLKGSNGVSTATFKTSALAVGTHTITVSFAGVGSLTADTATMSQVVQNTRTSLTESTASAVFGQNVALTATVSPASASLGVPGGTVTFMAGSTVLGTATLTNVNGVAKAILNTTALAVGTHSITAVYSGLGALSSSTSAAVSAKITKASTKVSLSSSSNPVEHGQTVTFTAVVVPVSPGAGVPTGTVTFKDGAKVLGTGTLQTVSGVTKATLLIALSTKGIYTITAAYGGDANFNGNSSASLAESVS